MKISTFFRTLAVASTVLASSAYASTTATLSIANGKLQGATNVSIGGNLYDVTFVEGSCNSLFKECGGPAPYSFVFTDVTSATAAAQALIDQVFVNTGNYAFDDDVSLTFGCAVGASCTAWVPYTVSLNAQSPVSNKVRAIGGQNRSITSTADAVVPLNFAANLDTADISSQVYAVFGLTPNADVPEPASLALMGVALAGLAAARRRKS